MNHPGRGMESLDLGGAGVPDRPIRPWPPGAPTLAEVAGVDPLGLRTMPVLPSRLYSGNFLYRPWPTHALDKQIVNLDYVPTVDPTNPDETWTLTIQSNFTVSINGLRRRLLRQMPLVTFNLYLLTRDWNIRDDELQALGLFKLKGNEVPQRAVLNGRRILREAVAPLLFFEDQENTAPHLPHRMNPNIILQDNRRPRS